MSDDEIPGSLYHMTGKPRAHVYIDGFNLYKGALSGTSFKWLDIEKWAKTLLPTHDVMRVVYCTARLKPDETDKSIHIRQGIYLRALRTLPTVKIYEGKFSIKEVRMWRRLEIGCKCCEKQLSPCKCCAGNTVPVIKREEKGSDVQLAIQLLHDGYKEKYDVALVVSNDSDIQPAIDLVRSEMGRKIIVADPRNSFYPSLKGDERREIRPRVLSNCQLPLTLLDQNGNSISRPTSWA